MTSDEIKNGYEAAEKIISEENFTRDLTDNEGNVSQGLLVGIVTVPNTAGHISNSAIFTSDETQKDESYVRVFNKTNGVVNFCAYVNDCQSTKEASETANPVNDPPTSEKATSEKSGKIQDTSQDGESSKLDDPCEMDQSAPRDENSKIDETPKKDEASDSDKVSKKDDTPKTDETLKIAETSIGTTDEMTKNDQATKNDNAFKSSETAKVDETSKDGELSNPGDESQNFEKPQNENNVEEVLIPKNGKNTEEPQSDENIKHNDCSKEHNCDEQEVTSVEKMEIEKNETCFTTKYWEKSRGWILNKTDECHKMDLAGNTVACPVPKQCSKMWIFPNNTKDNGKCCEKGVSYTWDGENWGTLTTEKSQMLGQKATQKQEAEVNSKSPDEDKIDQDTMETDK